jgi:hypothetical protein
MSNGVSTISKGRQICAYVLWGVTVASLALLVAAVVQSRDLLTSPKHIAFFIGFPVSLIVASLWGLRNKSAHAPDAILLLASIVLPLYAAELFFLSQEVIRSRSQEKARQEVISQIRASGREYDSRSFRQFFVDNWAEGRQLYPRIYQLPQRTLVLDGMSVFPTSNLSNRWIVECVADGEFKVWLSDEFGFTNPQGAHGAGAEVVLVGDSFTAGECVSVTEDIGARLRSRSMTAVNLGIGGSGPLWQLANLIEYGLPLEPETVYWLFYEGNDFADLAFESTFPELVRYLASEPIGLRHRKVDVDAAVAELQRAEIQSLQPESSNRRVDNWRSYISSARRVTTLGRLRVVLGLHKNYDNAEQALAESLEKVLMRAKSLVELNGGRFVFVYVPDWTRFAGGSEHLKREPVLDLVARNKIPLIDILQEFQEHPDPLSLYPHRQVGHFTPEGYELIARRLAADYSEHTGQSVRGCSSDC